jgi:hypothetical protein
MFILNNASQAGDLLQNTYDQYNTSFPNVNKKTVLFLNGYALFTYSTKHNFTQKKLHNILNAPEARRRLEFDRSAVRPMQGHPAEADSQRRERPRGGSLDEVRE